MINTNKSIPSPSIPPVSNFVLRISIFLTICTFLGQAGDFNAIPQEPGKPYPHLGWLYFANDGLGHNYGGDEDDLRTYGFTTGYAFNNRFLATLDWESLTDRAYDTVKSMRNDEIKARLGMRFLNINRPAVHFSGMAGLGGMFHGNFATLDIQKKAHANGNARPRDLPEIYDRRSADGLGFIYSELYFPGYSLNLTEYAHLTHHLDVTTATTLSYWAVKEWTQIKVGLTYQYNRAESDGQVVRNINEAENGLWLSTKVMIGPVILERGFNLSRYNQVGNAGFRFTTGVHQNRSSGYRLTYAFGFPIGHNSNYETFQIHPFKDLSRLAVMLALYQSEDTYNYDQWRRLKKTTTVGPVFYFRDPDQCNYFNFFVCGGAGMNHEALTTGDHDQYRSIVLKEMTLPTAHAGTGCRIEIPDFLTKNLGRYIGAEIKAEAYGSAGKETLFANPYFLLSWAMFISER